MQPANPQDPAQTLLGTNRAPWTRPKTRLLASIAVLASLPLLACERKPKAKLELAPATAPVSEVREVARGLIGAPQEVLQAESSAYGARLAFDAEDALLLTERAIYRVRADGHVETHAVSLGVRPVVAESLIFFWQDGWFHRTGKRGEGKLRWFREPREPVWTHASHDVPVWVTKEAAGGHVLRTRAGPKSITLYETRSTIVALTTLGGRAFLVEASGDGSWRFVSVSLDPSDAPPAVSALHSGRPPSLLAAGEDELVYYAGLTAGVRALSPDLQKNRAIQDDWICSPLTVAQGHVFCASIDGVGAASLTNGPSTWKKSVLPGPVTQIAASADHVAWILDRGENRLSLEIAPTLLKRP